MSKHTPGPWRHHSPAGSQHSIGGYVNASDDRQQPAICHVMGSEFSSAETQANAALIAAAPELLAAASALISLLMHPSLEADETIPEIADMQAAIKKAEGGKE